MTGLEKVSVTPETAAFADRSMGVALQRKGDIFLAMGNSQQGRDAYSKSLPIFERLMVTDSEEDWNRWNAAISHTTLGDISRQLGEPAEVARGEYEKGLALREELVANPRQGGPPAPAGPLLRRQAVAISYAKLGSLLVSAGDPAGGREYYVKALDISKELSKAVPKNLQFRQALAGSCLILADVYFRLRDESGARGYYDQAIKIREELAAAAPQNTRYKADVASAYAALGDLDLQLNKAALALEHYQKGHEMFEVLAKKDRSSSENIMALSTSYYRRATAKLYLKDLAGSDSDFEASLQLKEQLAKADPNNASYKAGMMLVQARLGRHADSAKLAQELAEKGAKDPSTLFRAASGYALSAAGVVHGKAHEEVTDADREQQNRYAESAIAALSQAVALGYKDVIALELDPDLLPLQAYPAYQELVANVRAKAAPAADARRP
jgi:tetratricopeptide (TPR) repeat protein